MVEDRVKIALAAGVAGATMSLAAMALYKRLFAAAESTPAPAETRSAGLAR